jgi:hypothetical protein
MKSEFCNISNKTTIVGALSLTINSVYFFLLNEGVVENNHIQKSQMNEVYNLSSNNFWKFLKHFMQTHQKRIVQYTSTHEITSMKKHVEWVHGWNLKQNIQSYCKNYWIWATKEQKKQDKKPYEHHWTFWLKEASKKIWSCKIIVFKKSM